MSKIRVAKSITTDICQHGTVTITLLDEAGRPFASCSFDPATADALSTELIVLVEEWRGGHRPGAECGALH